MELDSTTTMQVLQCTVPAGVTGGESILITAPGGAQYTVTVPAGLGPGQVFDVQVPAAASFLHV